MAYLIRSTQSLLFGMPGHLHAKQLSCAIIFSQKIDLFVVTETWFKESTRAVANITNTVPDHQLFNKPSIGRGEGGGGC